MGDFFALFVALPPMWDLAPGQVVLKQEWLVFRHPLRRRPCQKNSSLPRKPRGGHAYRAFHPSSVYIYKLPTQSSYRLTFLRSPTSSSPSGISIFLTSPQNTEHFSTDLAVYVMACPKTFPQSSASQPPPVCRQHDGNPNLCAFLPPNRANNNAYLV